MNTVLRCVLLPMGFLLLAASVDADVRADRRTELGILRVHEGAVAAAESLFISVLSESPHDARALTNLGNLHFLRGDPGLALMYYDRAASFDTSDAGIRLDRALALAWLGEDAESWAEAREGVRRAGGVQPAATLLGVHAVEDSTDIDKRAMGGRLTHEEVWALLRAAIRPFAPDTTSLSRARARVRIQRRSAGPRADDMSESSALLYWKR